MKSEYLKIELLFIDQDFKQLEIKDQINITLDINESVKYKKKISCLLQTRCRRLIKAQETLYFAKKLVKNIDEVKALLVNIVKNFLMRLKNLLQMHLELLEKEKMENQQKQMVILLLTEL